MMKKTKKPIFRSLIVLVMLLVLATAGARIFAASEVEIKKTEPTSQSESAPAPAAESLAVEESAAPAADSTTDEEPVPMQPAEEQSEEPEYTGPKEIDATNDFVKIIVNTMPVDTGRFLVRTVKGDPTRDTDDNKILIYGGAQPWTSYTTIRVDGQNYVFGGKTKRRAGRDALYGEVTEQPHITAENTVVTRCIIAGLDVTQTLSIAGGPVSKLFDTVKISYSVKNTTGQSHTVGVRVVIDTLLGSNDASPFKVGDRSITSETELSGADIQDYWIAYDSLEDPGVVARGTLRGPGLDTPDRVVFTNWGKLADSLWDFTVVPGTPFQREGESSMDSATALYWNENSISPQGELNFTTLYGIEYLNVTGDVLSIGALRNLGEWPTAKNQIRPYTLYAYVSDTSKIDLTDVTISLDLPDGIELAGDDNGVRSLGKLVPGQEQTVGWVVQPKVAAGGEKEIKIVGTAKEVAEQVVLKTNVTLLSPPGIDAKIESPEQVKKAATRAFGPYGPPFQVQIKCKNNGGSPIDNLMVELVLPQGLEFPHIQKPDQVYSRLEGHQEVVFSWKVNATGERSGDMKLGFKIISDSTEDKYIEKPITVDPLPVAIGWSGVPESAAKNMFFTAELFVTDIKSLGEAEFSVKYDPKVLQVVRVSQGTLFVENGQPLPWDEPQIDSKAGMVTGIKGRRTSPIDNTEGSLVLIHFRALGPGESKIDISDLMMADLSGNRIDYQFDPAKITVK